MPSLLFYYILLKTLLQFLQSLSIPPQPSCEIHELNSHRLSLLSVSQTRITASLLRFHLNHHYRSAWCWSAVRQFFSGGWSSNNQAPASMQSMLTSISYTVFILGRRNSRPIRHLVPSRKHGSGKAHKPRVRKDTWGKMKFVCSPIYFFFLLFIHLFYYYY